MIDDQETVTVLTPLELEVADLRRRLNEVADRVRIDANADAFLRGDLRVRSGDYCLINGHPTQAHIAEHDGRWTYHNGHNTIEVFRVPPSDDIQRLFTTAEVAEIVDKVRKMVPGWELRSSLRSETDRMRRVYAAVLDWRRHITLMAADLRTRSMLDVIDAALAEEGS